MKLIVINWLEPLIECFWENRNELRKRTQGGEVIDYPDYFGLPKVDLLQEHLENILKCKTKLSFAKDITELLSRDMIEVKS